MKVSVKTNIKKPKNLIEAEVEEVIISLTVREFYSLIAKATHCGGEHMTEAKEWLTIHGISDHSLNEVNSLSILAAVYEEAGIL